MSRNCKNALFPSLRSAIATAPEACPTVNLTILVLFHTSHFRDLKTFYLGYICQHMRKVFPQVISYNRFVERQAKVGLHLLLFFHKCALGKCTDISIIDSTPLVACHIKRMHMHKTMKGWAQKGKCTMGWFYGFKLHLVINDKGEIIQWQLISS